MGKAPTAAAAAEAAATAPAAEELDVDRLLYRCPIARPISSDRPKLTKKLYSLIHKAVEADKRRGITKGIKDVTKLVRKGKAAGGLIVLGADVSPFDVVSHFPVLLEQKGIPYVWVPSRADLGQATHCRRATSVVLLKPTPASKDSFDKCVEAVRELAGTAADSA
jgi:H/ACA ribonucleoprotein complex subunit 2